jgi:hypothetical protein
MRTLLSVSLTALMLSTVPVCAADRDTALAVIGEAIKAHGGADGLAKTQQMLRTANGVLTINGKDTPFTDEVVFSLPDRYHHTIFLGPGGGDNRPKVVAVIAKNQGWRQSGGMTVELEKAQVEEMRRDAYVLWLTTLTSLEKDNGFTLTPLPDEKVDGNPAAVIKVARKGQTDVRLLFDKSSKLLIKADLKISESGVEYPQEYFFSDHKEFDGVKLPTKILETRSGQKFTGLSDVKYKPLGRIDDAKFGKP